MTDGPSDPEPTRPTTPSYTATPLTGPTVPYGAPTAAPAAETVAVEQPRPRGRLALLVGGIAAASLLVVAAAFGGGVVLGTQLGGPQSGFSIGEGGVPGDGPGGGRPEPPGGFGGQNGQDQGGDSGTGS